MNYLALDTSGKNLTVVVNKNGEIYKYYDSECGTNHSVTLMPKIEELILKADFDLKKADFLAVVVGAGSFTGIRIGVSTIKALCFSYNLPALSITSFDTLAYNVKSGKVLSVIDASHGGFYVVGYENGEVIIEPSYMLKDELDKIKDGFTLVSSSQVDGLECKTVSVVDGLINAIEQKKDLAVIDLDLVTPLYVRKSQAEEGRK